MSSDLTFSQWSPTEPGAPGTRQPHSITALPTHSDRDLGEDPMFSCCLPVSRGRCLRRGSDESVFSRGRRWIRTRTQRKGRLWPFSRRRHSESSTRAKEGPQLVKEEPQLVHEDPRPMPSREGPPLSPNRRKALFTSVLQCCACGIRTRTEDLEPKEAEPKGEKVENR
ncbi:hypothetical protein QTO34_016799 [Cnephaeus nilssonii]|uniref:Uncharacterized protein n=1 Tax=Cnephaeus nilssonii TaxID=3371016 RepID=A0AA40LQ36_CNENI|nr:hypothetical protein QTO34_016799 [Eptesicus nilssonii]